MSRDEQIDVIPAEDSVPAPMVGSRSSSNIQTTVRKLHAICNRQPT